MPHERPRPGHQRTERSRSKLDGVEVAPALAQLAPVKALNEKVDENLLERHRLHCAALLGLCEGKLLRTLECSAY